MLPVNAEGTEKTEEAASKSDTEVRYVLSGQPTGWAAMAKEAREFDGERVKDCKEDIDTLLVFAGLFSAVLSAFLVAAYPSLQPDRDDLVVYTLQRIATQTVSYEFNGTTLTATSTLPSSLPPFKPSDNDIRVNVLWFSSLIISLITASLGILVKQWLREFLAVENTSPQARLRIRHYREPQIRKWKVYEIAAVLPLLLQLSLGLFFVGLCYFTAAIHSSIGHTTLPLVIGWVLSFFTVTLLPLFFPRCPYKTVLLKVAVAELHHAILQLVSKNRPMRRSPSRTERIFAWARGLSWLQFLNPVSIDLGFVPENEVISDSRNDLKIVVSVDAIQANDELFVTAVTETLRNTRPHWVSVVDVTVRVLAHRILAFTPTDNRVVLAEWPFHDVFPFSSSTLRPQISQGILAILSEYIITIPVAKESSDSQSRLEPQSWRQFRRTRDAFFLVLSAAYASTDLVASNANLKLFLRIVLLDRDHAPRLWRLWFRRAYLGTATTTTTIPFSIGWSTDSTDGGQVGRAHPLSILAKLIGPLNLTVVEGVECFKHMLPHVTSVDASQMLSGGAWPEDSSVSFQTAALQYFFALVSEEFQRLASRSDSLEDTKPATITASVLAQSLHLLPSDVNDGLLASLLSVSLQQAVLRALRTQPGTGVLLDALYAYEKNIHWVIMISTSNWRPSSDRTHAANKELSMIYLRTAIVDRLTQPVSIDLVSTLKICQSVLFVLLFINAGHEERKIARSIFHYLNTFLSPFVITQSASSNNEIQGHSTVVLELASTCLEMLKAVDPDVLLAFGTPHKDRFEKFIVPKSLVAVLRRLCRSSMEYHPGVRVPWRDMTPKTRWKRAAHDILCGFGGGSISVQDPLVLD